MEDALQATRVCGHPQRIAVLSPHILDVILALGAQPAAYAESTDLDVRRFDNPAAQIPYLGDRIETQPINLGDRKSPSLEKLTMLQPDLILGEHWLVGENYRLLSHIAPTLLFTDSKDGIQNWSNSMEGIAKALDREEAIEKITAEHLRQVDAARQSLAPVIAALPKMMVLSVNSALTDVAIAADSTVGYLLEEIGFKLVLAQESVEREGRWLHISPEILPSLEADISIVIGWDASEFYNQEAELKENWNKTPVLRELPVTKANRVLFTDYQLWGSNTRGPITDELILSKLPGILLPLLSR